MSFVSRKKKEPNCIGKEQRFIKLTYKAISQLSAARQERQGQKRFREDKSRDRKFILGIS